MDLGFGAVRTSLQRRFRSGQVAGAMMLSGILLVLFSATLLVSEVKAEPLAEASAVRQQQGAAGGRAIFDEKCSGCHTIGGGKLIGPDLKDVTKRRDPQWIKSFILDPPKMLASDPVAQQLLKENNNVSMPNLSLTADQADQLIAFLTDPSAAPAASKPVVPAGAGDPQAGKLLFTGEVALTNRGPSCITCHTVGGAGSLGGGGLGPDLTHVVQRLGEPGLTGALKTIAFPTMLGPFQNRPLTAKEQADLIAFLKDADRMQPQVPVATAGTLNNYALTVFGIASTVAALLFRLLGLFWARLKKRYSPNLPVRRL